MSFFVFIFGIFSLFRHVPSNRSSKLTTEQKIYKVQEQIDELYELKNTYLERAAKHIDLAKNFSLGKPNSFRSKRHLKLAEENNNIAKKLKSEIKLLKSKKKELTCQID